MFLNKEQKWQYCYKIKTEAVLGEIRILLLFLFIDQNV